MRNVRLCGFLWLVAVAAVAAGQQRESPTFEVASVKVFTDPVLTMSGVTTQPGGRLAAKATTLKDLVAFAHDVLLRDIEGGADWMTAERFDIEAKAKEEASLEQFRVMVRSLLAERFALRVRTVAKTVDAHALITARGGLRLKPSEPGACDPPKPPCVGPITLVGRMIGTNVSMSELALALSRILDRPVVDRTEQSGYFTGLKLDWVPDESQYAGWGLRTWANPVSDRQGPALTTALQEQLGLRFEPTKAPVNVIVIESATRPTPN